MMMQEVPMSGAHESTTQGADGDARPIRFGVMGDGTTYPAWIADCIRQVRALPNVELSALVVDSRQQQAPSGWRARFSTLRDVFLSRNGLWRLY